MIKLKSLLYEFESTKDYILVGSIDADDYRVVAIKYDMNHPNSSHDRLLKNKHFIYPKNWRMRSDDRIVKWWNEPTEKETDILNHWMHEKMGYFPKSHVKHPSFKDHVKSHEW